MPVIKKPAHVNGSIIVEQTFKTPPTPESTTEEKIAYFNEKLSTPEMVDPYTDGTKTKRTLDLLEGQLQTFSTSKEELFKICKEVKGTSFRHLRMPLSGLPDDIIKQSLDARPDKGPEGTGLISTLMSMCRMANRFNPWDNNKIDEEALKTKIYLAAFDNANLQTYSGILPSFNDEEQFNVLMTRLYRYEDSTNGRKTSENYQNFLTMIRSPYCIHPDTVAAMHTMLVNHAVGMSLSRYSREAPDSTLRLHAVDRTITLKHSEIMDMWYYILDTMRDERKYFMNPLMRQSFVEFLCTGNLVAGLYEVIQDTVLYAQKRFITLRVLEALKQRVDYPKMFSQEFN